MKSVVKFNVSAKVDLHIVPQNDLRRHEEIRACWCHPRVKHYPRGSAVVHNALDGRELVEVHGVN